MLVSSFFTFSFVLGHIFVLVDSYLAMFNLLLFNYPLLIQVKFPNLLQDGRINYEEFVAMMRSGNPDLIANKRRK
jgi:hypothetical protein